MNVLFVVKPGTVYGPNGEYTEGMQLELPECVETAFPDKLMRFVEVEEDDHFGELDYLTSEQIFALAAAGFGWQVELDNATDESLLAVTGIGKATLAKIRDNRLVE